MEEFNTTSYIPNSTSKNILYSVWRDALMIQYHPIQEMIRSALFALLIVQNVGLHQIAQNVSQDSILIKIIHVLLAIIHFKIAIYAQVIVAVYAYQDLRQSSLEEQRNVGDATRLSSTVKYAHSLDLILLVTNALSNPIFIIHAVIRTVLLCAFLVQTSVYHALIVLPA